MGAAMAKTDPKQAFKSTRKAFTNFLQNLKEKII